MSECERRGEYPAFGKGCRDGEKFVCVGCIYRLLAKARRYISGTSYYQDYLSDEQARSDRDHIIDRKEV